MGDELHLRNREKTRGPNLTKIFITIPWFLPAFRAGGPIQSIANLVKEFSDQAEYYIFCSDKDLNGGTLDNITTGQWVPFNEHTKVWYAAPAAISDNLVKQVEALKPDVLYIIGLFSWHYNLVPLIYCKAPRKILSARGMLHPGALSQKKWKKKIFLSAFKLFEYHHKVLFHATDEDERRFIHDHFGSVAQTYVAGNFPNRIGQLPIAPKEAGSLHLVTIALISPMKNILEVLTAIAACEFAVDYKIYGPVKDVMYWERCKAMIKTLPPNIRVTYLNDIEPAKVKEALRDAHVFIMPSKSENFGHSLYEALSAGRPVITSGNTPWNHLKESSSGINVSLNDEGVLTDAINFFCAMNDKELNRWSVAAHNYAEAAVNKSALRTGYEKMFFG
jgi:glycosyltransferase involved in cell wall biosynthesis